MRTYEALYIIVPTLEDDAVQTVANGVESLITENGGTIVRSEVWGKRRLAYTVNKHREGNYVLLRFQADSACITKLDAHFRLAEDILRNLVQHLEEKTLRLEEEQAKRTAALIEARNARGPGAHDDDDDVVPRRSKPAAAAAVPAESKPFEKAAEPAAKAPEPAVVAETPKTETPVES